MQTFDIQRAEPLTSKKALLAVEFCTHSTEIVLASVNGEREIAVLPSNDTRFHSIIVPSSGGPITAVALRSHAAAAATVGRLARPSTCHKPGNCHIRDQSEHSGVDERGGGVQH